VPGSMAAGGVSIEWMWGDTPIEALARRNPLRKSSGTPMQVWHTLLVAVFSQVWGAGCSFLSLGLGLAQVLQHLQEMSNQRPMLLRCACPALLLPPLLAAIPPPTRTSHLWPRRQVWRHGRLGAVRDAAGGTGLAAAADPAQAADQPHPAGAQPWGRCGRGRGLPARVGWEGGGRTCPADAPPLPRVGAGGGYRTVPQR
jgi:hypothetical protein